MTDSEVKKKVEPSLEAICGGVGGVERAARVSRRATRWRVETLIIIIFATETKNAIARAGAPESRDRARREPVPRRRRGRDESPLGSYLEAMRVGR